MSAYGTAGYVTVLACSVYDSNITIDIDATTTQTYHGTLVIATQNSLPKSAVVYGDPTGVIASSIYICPPTGTGTAADMKIRVYFTPQLYSKNLFHIRGVGLSSFVSAATFTAGSVPVDGTWRPTDALASNYQKKITVDAGTPTGGNDGDLWIKTNDGIYYKASGTWSKVL